MLGFWSSSLAAHWLDTTHSSRPGCCVSCPISERSRGIALEVWAVRSILNLDVHYSHGITNGHADDCHFSTALRGPTTTYHSYSQIFPLANMHHLVFGTSRFSPSASPFSSRFTSSTTSQLISVIIPTVIIYHSFTLSLQAQNLPFQQILPTVDFLYLLDCLTLISLFLVSHFNFLFIPCGRLSWLPVSFLLHVKYKLSYRIV